MKTKEIISQALSKNISTIIYFIGTLIITATLQIFCILILRTLVDNIFVTPVEEAPSLAAWIALFVVSNVVMVGIGLINKNLALTISSSVSTNLSKAAYSASIRSEIQEIEKIDKQELVTKILDDSTYIGEVYIGKNLFLFFRNIVYIISFFISMMIISPILGLIAFGAIPIFYTLIRSYDKYFSRVSSRAEISKNERSRSINDDLVNIRSIKLRNGIIQAEEDMGKLDDKFNRTQRSYGIFKDIKDNKLNDLLIGLLMGLLLGVGGYLSTRGTHIPGTIVAVVIMTTLVYRMVKQLMYNNIMPSFIESELESLENIITVKSEFKAEPITSLDEIHSFKFQDVSYSTRKAKISNVNFELKRGEKLGILSLEENNDKLIFELLTKLVRPKEGIISINNCDYNKINTIYLRSLITAIPDERHLFNETIANNIIYPLAFDEYKYNDALNKSGLKNMLSQYPDKDQTVINEENSLDTEMIHRIIFANAFYKDSKIFVLNETNTKLDPRSEEALMQEIFELKNKITIVITDKNYSILNCNKVLILGKGEVVEYGKVDELINNKNSTLYKLIKKVKTIKSANVS